MYILSTGCQWAALPADFPHPKLVYHYFKSKDQVMNELFTERWSLLLAAIDESRTRPFASAHATTHAHPP